MARSEMATQYISDKILENKHIVYKDRTCVITLEDFLEKAVKERLYFKL
jgi:hypothetical protein